MSSSDGSAQPERIDTFCAAGRQEALGRVSEIPYDVCVIGGGIVGAGIARDAAMRGLRAVLFEQGDFASGTSSRSSKLLHGGLRYLEQLEFKLVWESCHERAMLRGLIPHLAEPLPFLFPVYQGQPLGPKRLEVALWMYDAMAGLHNLGRHQRLGQRGMTEREPRLLRQGLRGGSYYYDVVTDDARLTLENARSAWAHGADVLSYARVEELVEENGRVCGVRVRDVAAGGRADAFAVSARCVISAAGPWSDQVRHRAGLTGKLLRPTKGVHLLLQRSVLPLDHAVVMANPGDHRILFTIPWGSATIVGTTDTDYEGRPEDVRADASDVDYILGILRHYFPEVTFRLEDVLATYAGLRPLVDDRSASESQVSREHRLQEERPGLLTIAGGKLTTFRIMAAQVVDRAVDVLRRQGGTSASLEWPTATEPIVGPAVANLATDLPPDLLGHLARVYGSRAGAVAAMIAERPEHRAPLSAGHPDVLGQAIYAARREMALHLDDALSRRTHALLTGIRLEEAEAASRALAAELGWDEERRCDEVRRFSRSWEDAQGWRGGIPVAGDPLTR